MTFKVFLVNSAVEDFKMLPTDSFEVMLNWMNHKLCGDPLGGVALLGRLEGLRSISKSQQIRVVYMVDAVNKQVLVMGVFLEVISIERKIDELKKRVAARSASRSKEVSELLKSFRLSQQ